MASSSQASSAASGRRICEEFLKVLGRREPEQALICQKTCICAQIWRYQHYLLPLWDWGIDKIVCFGLGSFRNVEENGGPFSRTTYRQVMRDARLRDRFNTAAFDRHDALQAMLRHVAVIDMATSFKFCSSKRGIEHGLIKDHFKKLTLIQDAPGSAAEIDPDTIKKLAKLPPTAAYGGDEDFTNIPIFLHDDEYTAEDRDAWARLAEITRLAHQPPISMLDFGEGYDRVDERTLVYTVDPDFPVRTEVLRRCRPAAMIWRSHAERPKSGDILTGDVLGALDEYEEFPLDKRTAPHTVGSSQVYIRKDLVAATENMPVVPPYPVQFPDDFPSKPKRWYLDELKKRAGVN